MILPDLRGYGDSSLPEPAPDHINYSFRAMSEDLLEIMDQLGYRNFMSRATIAARARRSPHVHGSSRAHYQSVPDGHRAEPLRVDAHDQNWAIGTWHWAFMAQPDRFPERLISAVPAEYFLKTRMVIRGGDADPAFSPIGARRVRALLHVKTIAGSCRDYRATATCDFAMDTADKHKQLAMPLMLLWGARGHPPERAREFLNIWKQYATNITAWEALPAAITCRKKCPTISTIIT